MKEVPSTLNRVTSQSLARHTGRGWAEWCELLNKAKAQTWTHQETVAFLKKKYRVTPWWQQIVAAGYHIAIGRRIEGQNLKGQYSLTVTKSLHLDAKQVWKYLVSEKGLAVWLEPLSKLSFKVGAEFETESGAFGQVRTLQANRRARLTWQEPEWNQSTTAQVLLVPRKGDRCLLAFQHEKIPTPRLKAALRMYWRQRIEQIALDLKNKSDRS